MLVEVVVREAAQLAPEHGEVEEAAPPEPAQQAVTIVRREKRIVSPKMPCDLVHHGGLVRGAADEQDPPPR
jgi:hypothetical protein